MIERTTDYRIINRLVSWKVRVSRECFYLLEKAGDQINGVWSFEPYQKGVRIHADLGEACRGKDAIKSARESFRWIFKNTDTKTIYAGIPEKNKPACLVASRAGMIYIKHVDNQRWFEIWKGSSYEFR